MKLEGRPWPWARECHGGETELDRSATRARLAES